MSEETKALESYFKNESKITVSDMNAFGKLIKSEIDKIKTEATKEVETKVKEVETKVTQTVTTGIVSSSAHITAPKQINDGWGTIKENIQKGDIAKYSIGDYKIITVGSEQVKCEIAGINTYYGVKAPQGGSNKPIGMHIDFISEDCLKTGSQFNATNINNGSGSTGSAATTFGGSDVIYQYLNTTIYNQLPSDLKSVIIDKYCYAPTRPSGQSSDQANIWCSIGKLWLPFPMEVFNYENFNGTNSGAVPCYFTWKKAMIADGCNVLYDIFRWYGARKRLKGLGYGTSATGNTAVWWLAEAYEGNTSSVCDVYSIGDPSNDGARYTNGVPLCFRIGVDSGAT